MRRTKTKTMSAPITRKTLAQTINRELLAKRIGGDVNAERIRKNEDNWGLRQTRCDTGSKAVLYDRDRALEILKRRHLI